MPSFTVQPVWNTVTRVWHWLLAVAVIPGWLIGEYRDFDIMQWHFYAGYCTGALLSFRLLLGFVGPPETRFSTLFKSLPGIFSYLTEVFRREPSGARGHSPMGSLATLAMLACLLFQVATGLFAEDDDIFFEGPLATYAPSSVVSDATSFHHLGAKALLILFAAHIAVMLFYFLWKKENLVTAMITGRKLVKQSD